MQSAVKKVYIHAPIERVWELISNHEGYSDVFEGVTSSRLLTEGKGDRNSVIADIVTRKLPLVNSVKDNRGCRVYLLPCTALIQIEWGPPPDSRLIATHATRGLILNVYGTCTNRTE